MQGIRTVVLLSLLMIGVVAAGLWFGLRDPVAPEEGGDGQGGESAPRPEEVLPPLVPEPGLAASRHGRGTVTGRVQRFRTGEAVGDVIVRIFSPTGGRGARRGQPPSDAPVAEEVTDAEGAFAFQGVPAGGGYEVRIEHKEFAPIRRPGVVVLNGEVTDLGTLYLEVAVEVTVRVEDGGGKAIPAAKVELFADQSQSRSYGQGNWTEWVFKSMEVPAPIASAVTDEKGVAKLSDVPTGFYLVSAVAEGFGRGGARKLLSPDTAGEEIVLRLVIGYRLAGSVTDAAGARVSGMVQVSGQSYGGWWGSQAVRWAAEIDEEGEYLLTGLPPGPATLMVLRAEGAAYPAGTVSVPDVERFDIELAEGAVLLGTVRDEQGDPIEGAEVRVVINGGQWGGTAGASAVTDGGGEYRIEGLARGQVGYLEVLADGFARYPPPGTYENQLMFSPGEEYRKDVELARGAVLTGVVTAELGGTPLSGASVTILPRSTWGSRGETVTTDSEGRYRFAAVAPGEYVAQIQAEGYLQPGLPENQWRVSRPGLELDDRWKVRIEIGVAETTRDFALEPGTAVAGTVFDSLGEPVGGVMVYLPGIGGNRPLTTGADGSFEFKGLAPRSNAMVYATGPGRNARSEPFTIPDSGRVEGIRLVLKSPGVITGTVQLSSGGPPPGGTAAAVSGDARTQPWLLQQAMAGVPLGSDGSFRIEDAPAGSVTVVASVPGQPRGASDLLNIPEGGEVAGVVIRLDEGKSVHGEVVAAEGGGPIGGARITIYSNDAATRFQFRGVVAISGPAGQFTIAGILPGTYTIVADAGEAGRGVLANTDPTSGDTVRVEIAGSETIEGRVVDRSGAGVAGMLVQAQLMSAAPSGNSGTQGGQATTSVDGTFKLTGLKKEAYRVIATSGWTGKLNYARGTKEGVRPGDPGVEIRVEAGLAISGRVYGADGQPLYGQVVRAYSGNDNRYSAAGMDGSFEIVGLTPGAYVVSADASGGKMATVTIPDVAAGTTGLRIQVQEAQEIAGRVFGPDGAPAQGVQVRAEPMPGAPGSQGGGNTGGNGEFRIRRLAPGTYRLTFQAPGRFAELLLNDVASGASGVSVQMEVGLTISGVAVDGTDTPAPGVNLEAIAKQGGLRVRAATDKEGKFTFGGLSEGEYTVTVIHSPGGLVLGSPVTARTGKDDLKLKLVPGLTLRGRVVDRNGRGIDQAWINVSNLSRGGTRTSSGGEFELKGLPLGKLTLQVWANGQSVRQEVEATAGSVEIRIE